MRETAAPPRGDRLRAIVEALVFAAEEPLQLEDLVDLFPGTDAETLRAALEVVAVSCETEERGLMVQRVAGGYRMTTKPHLGEWVRALFRSRNRRRLSSQALETLAIIAYRQPITTPEIQTIRGSDPSSVLEALLEKKLVRIMGRKKVVGKPFLYGTTPQFLAHFGLNSLQDLPDAADFGALVAAGETTAAPREAVAVARENVDEGPFQEEDGENGEDTSEDDEDDNERGDDGDDS